MQPSADHSRPRLRGDMYLRAEQRKRDEMAADDRGIDRTPASTFVASATEIQTPAPGPTTTTVVPARPASDFIEAVAIELPAAPRPALATKRRQQRLMPAATLGAAAIVATLGVALTLSPGNTSEERTTQAVATAPAPAPVAPAKTATAKPGPAITGAAATPAPAAIAPARPVVRTAPTRPVNAPAVASVRALDGQIRVTSTPSGARVTVDGIGWGQTPLTVGHVAFGTKTVRLTRDGYTAQQAIVRVSPDTPTQSVNVSLRRRVVRSP